MPYASLEDFIKAADVEHKSRDLLESTAKNGQRSKRCNGHSSG
jgi:hypothetical protein